ncbi:MAG: SapC family protein [Pseudomonadota bacterium]
MSETGAAAPQLSGQVFLYEKPELLMKDKHQGLGLSPASKPFGFAAKVRAVPLTAREFTVAQASFPIVFTTGEGAQPLAVVGIFEDDNLFVGEDGQWERHAYIPGYLRRYPYAFAGDQGSDRMALVIDTQAEMIQSNPQFPFFAGDDLSDSTKQAMEFCKNYEQERRGTTQLMEKLTEYNLLGQQEARFKPDGEEEERVVASYVGVEEQKLRELSPEALVELRDSGMLALIYAQLISMANWRRLLERRALRLQSGGAVAANS